MSDYYGGGAEQTRGKTFTADSDATTLLRGSDSGPTPMEYLLHALASCLTIGVATIAAQRGIRLNAVEATAEGDVDIRGVLGVPADDRPGFHGIRITFDIKGEADREELGDILRQAKARSPVFEILTSGAPVELGMGSR